MTPNKEDYLKCIHELGQIQLKISNKMIAEKMQVSPPAVSEMLKKMINQEWIQKDVKKGYLLTEKGSDLVANLYRKHRLIEVFLINQLGYSPQEVHQEAEILEHTVSNTFIDRLDENLGFPTFCPHGGTIPRKNEPLKEINHQTLNQLSSPGTYKLARIHDHIELINYLEQHDLRLNTLIELQQIDNFAKTYTISYNNKTLTIPEMIAEQLYISEA
ncbi:metal-dependent transcriptional regulator [Streptococcus pseudoporcinus]|uniref:Manganese transport regulator n=2 Tax=Streptococcus pseudoporcinus TaxID=361101 RepID=G5KB20_9STRE|nr:metal-dependent transcriptional regulator [Streptococcus pseudoporcinus]EFR43429.1 iron dependent repressor DNA binding domain protein [Streptococcus pseudoporcinus SPIN 20026]EHI65502.1 iron dependent repressor, metal binding/dimerization domain protein [Streptococcus pseudoporcinus LQ 940-04]VEF94399.1 metal-dependent transcriptional regulator [Streptococcus pseudoporcinus]VTS35941.1 metal-dependent transcriptional regulator [Streptococcus pseudoporcinus]